MEKIYKSLIFYNYLYIYENKVTQYEHANIRKFQDFKLFSLRAVKSQ